MEIGTEQLSGKKCLRFIFNGYLLLNEAKNGIVLWRKAFRASPDAKFIIIWDCLKMTGYDKQARQIWQLALGEFKNQIEAIWVISNSKIYQIAAALMGVMMPFKIRTVTSDEKIQV